MLHTLALAGALALSCTAAPAAPYFGTTYAGGANGAGAVFERAHGHRTILYSFCARPNCADGGNPLTNVVPLKDGSLIGTTSTGGRGDGTIFRLSPAPGGKWAETTLFDFCEYFGQCARFGVANGTIQLVGRHKIRGAESDEDGRGVFWSFDWTNNGYLFSPDEYWNKHGR
jgi:uncharacterized repeat protein (TIGR03803 family)